MTTYRRILLCYDATREGRCALRLGACLARELGAETHLLAVLDDTRWTRGLDVVPAIPFELEEQTSKDILREGVVQLATLGVVAQGHLAIGNPMMQIPAFANALLVDLVVVAHHRSGLLARWWTGQDDGRLLDRITCSVLVAMNSQEPDTPNDDDPQRRASREAPAESAASLADDRPVTGGTAPVAC